MYQVSIKINLKDIDRLTYLGATSGKGGLKSHFKDALIVAENLFDERRGIKSSGGSLPFQKIIKNVVSIHLNFQILLSSSFTKLSGAFEFSR